ncbi:MAG TPA: hypothetical protein VKU83_07830 [Puia sp.]|nr:hypothetical protein [Puia sp.]
MDMPDFLLAVITAPGQISGEAGSLEAMLEAGVQRVHLRKPGGSVQALAERLAPRWASRLVLHGSEDLARDYGIGQVHGPVRVPAGGQGGEAAGAGQAEAASGEPGPGELGGAGGGTRFPGRVRIRRSTSVHSWEDLRGLPEGLEYAFISPLFDSISKPGYGATAGLLDMPGGPYPCRPVGLGGVSAGNIELMRSLGWKGAALMGWLWESPGETVRRFKQIKKIVDG